MNSENPYEILNELKELFNVDTEEEAIERLGKVLPLVQRMNEAFPNAIRELKRIER